MDVNITPNEFKKLSKMRDGKSTKRAPQKIPVCTTLEEFKKLIKATRREHHKLAFLLGFGAGLRISEVVNLEKRHIREDSILIENGKGGKDRIVPIPKGFKYKHLMLLPFTITVRALQKAFKTACKKAGLLDTKPSLHFHSLRHGFATRMVEQGVPINQIKLAMGHSNISTTGVYLRASPKNMLDSYKELF